MSAVLELGPMWVKEKRAGMQRRRESLAKSAANCKPDGDYRKQMEMVVRELDAMLAANDLLAALESALAMICEEVADGHHTTQAIAARAAIAKAKGVNA